VGFTVARVAPGSSISAIKRSKLLHPGQRQTAATQARGPIARPKPYWAGPARSQQFITTFARNLL
jgi:hypothetical protein